MVKNYLKVALRNLMRQKGYTALNILGLTVGITSSLLILLYIFYETSFDNFHSKADRIYRISSEITEPDNTVKWVSTQTPLGYTLKNEFSEVEQYVRFASAGRNRFEKDEINYFEENIYYVDSTVFDVFDFDFIAGDPETALDEPNAIVINESMANRIFKGENPIGQSLKSDNDRIFQVKGVYKDMPSNSHIIADAMISIQTVFDSNSGSWGSFGIYTYVLLNNSSNYDLHKEHLDEIIDKRVATIFDQYNITIKYHLLPIETIHLNSDFEGEPVATGNMNYIYIFMVVGIFLIVIASINYMNLATARSAKRSLEVGVRKVMGAHQSSLIFQFLTESVLITLAATLISIASLALFLAPLNNVLGTQLDIIGLWQPQVLWSLFGIILLTGVIGGAYPAFYLSSFNPKTVMSGSSIKSGNQILRKALVILQFGISIFMLIGTLVIYNQMKFVENKDLGFDKEQIMHIRLNSRLAREKWPVFKNKLLQSSLISNVSTSSTFPGNGNYSKNLMPIETEEGVMDEKGLDHYAVDQEYFNTLDIEFIEGRNFSKEYATDLTEAMIVNEAMVDRMNWSNPIGKKLYYRGNDSIPVKVIGVVRNFHQKSLHEEIAPLVFFPNEDNSSILIKIEGDIKTGIKTVESEWKNTYSGLPFEYTFIDEAFMKQYQGDELRGKLFLGFSFMTILIASLGLLGLASYTSEQRSKEISIRKVLGANSIGLVNLVVKDFVFMILLAAIPASILAYIAMQDWLDNFEYHVSINALAFIIVILGTIILTVFTTGYHAGKSALANPAERLKYE